MRTKVIVKINDADNWERTNDEGQMSGKSTANLDYLKIVVETLTEALEQAKSELKIF